MLRRITKTDSKPRITFDMFKCMKTENKDHYVIYSGGSLMKKPHSIFKGTEHDKCAAEKNGACDQ